MTPNQFHGKRTNGPRAAIRVFRAGLLVLGLSACENVADINPFVESETYPCPKAAILADAAAITVFRQGSPGDVLDIALRSRLAIETYQCAWNLNPETHAGTLVMSIAVTADTFRGPGLRDERIALPYFVAVTNKNRQVLVKSQFNVVADLPPNARRFEIRDRRVTVEMPVAPHQRETDFALLAGFQLTPDQLDYNRSKRRQETRRR